ncbi:MAG: hypothetical protein WC562_04075 [Dehalococcoidia bacterium]
MSDMEEVKETRVESEVTAVPQKRPIKDWLLEPAVIIALISGLAYLCAYIYEIGYCYYFGIPYDLIIINWTRFLISIFPFSVFLFAELLPHIVRKFRNLSFITLVVFLFIFSYYPIQYCNIRYGFLIPLTPFLIIFVLAVIGGILLILLYPLERTRRQERGRGRKGIETDDIKKEANKEKAVLISSDERVVLITSVLIFGTTVFIYWIYYRILLDQAWQWSVLIIAFFLSLVGPVWSKTLVSFTANLSPDRQEARRLSMVAITLICIFIFFWLSIDAGRDVARTEKEYFVTSSNQSMVVLRIYGDNAICVPWYKEGNKSYITKEFVILPLENITLIPQEIGPLQVKSAE